MLLDPTQLKFQYPTCLPRPYSIPLSSIHQFNFVRHPHRPVFAVEVVTNHERLLFKLSSSTSEASSQLRDVVEPFSSRLSLMRDCNLSYPNVLPFTTPYHRPECITSPPLYPDSCSHFGITRWLTPNLLVIFKSRYPHLIPYLIFIVIEYALHILWAAHKAQSFDLVFPRFWTLAAVIIFTICFVFTLMYKVLATVIWIIRDESIWIWYWGKIKSIKTRGAQMEIKREAVEEGEPVGGRRFGVFLQNGERQLGVTGLTQAEVMCVVGGLQNAACKYASQQEQKQERTDIDDSVNGTGETYVNEV